MEIIYFYLQPYVPVVYDHKSSFTVFERYYVCLLTFGFNEIGSESYKSR